jgi:hypothetical protein
MAGSVSMVAAISLQLLVKNSTLLLSTAYIAERRKEIEQMGQMSQNEGEGRAEGVKKPVATGKSFSTRYQSFS